MTDEDKDRGTGRHLQRVLVAGVVVVVPLAVTFHVLVAMLAFFDNRFQPLIETAIGMRLPGLGLLATVLVIYGAGLLATNVLGRRVLEMTDSVLGRVPGVGQIYRGTQRVVHSVSRKRELSFQQVVFLQFPRVGIRALGFVTSRMKDAEGRTHCSVFVPTTPMPTSGYLVLVPEEDLEPSSFTVEEGIEFVISAGVSAPPLVPMVPPSGSAEQPVSEDENPGPRPTACEVTQEEVDARDVQLGDPGGECSREQGTDKRQADTPAQAWSPEPAG